VHRIYLYGALIDVPICEEDEALHLTHCARADDVQEETRLLEEWLNGTAGRVGPEGEG
jgi:hypothetical protein